MFRIGFPVMHKSVNLSHFPAGYPQVLFENKDSLKIGPFRLITGWGFRLRDALNPCVFGPGPVYLRLNFPLMTISCNWLHEYLPERLDPHELSDILTAVGLEVESLSVFESVKGGLQGLVIGKVLECRQHPNADKLRLTLVDLGGPEPVQIVCGAPNVAAGQTVVVAPVGTTVHPLRGEPFEIKKAKIRGEESSGMICAEDEIGLGESHDGIIVLEDGPAPGTCAREYYRLPVADHVYEIGLTPNRMDAMSHLGVARDVCAWLSHARKQKYTVRYPETKQTPGDGAVMPVQVEDADRCARYMGLCLEGIQSGPSPEWMQQRLLSIGLRPINVVVDITNYVLHECGQPLHAFDRDKIRGGTVVVKTLPAETPFVTLDGRTLSLHAEDLMICDAEGPMCLAGIYGGKESGVTEQTTSVFLESAWFHPESIRKSSVRHGLRTDAAARFEKGADISQLPYALWRAAELMVQYAGARIASPVSDTYPTPREKTRVAVTCDRIRALAGKAYSNEDITGILESLGFGVEEESAGALTLSVPFSKPDISMSADIVEEVMRIDGLDQIPFTGEIRYRLPEQTGYSADQERIIAAQLVGKGFFELFTNSITNAAFYPDQDDLVKMLNSLSANLDAMRPSMLESGLEAIAYNLNRKNQQLRFFEWGKVYARSAEGFAETPMLALYATGHYRSVHFSEKPRNIDAVWMRGIVEALFPQLGLSFKAADAGLNILYRNQVIGHLQAVSAERLQRFDIRQPVWYANLNWSVLEKALQGYTRVFREIPRFPAVHRDLAMILDRGVTYDALEAAVKQAKPKRLQHMNLFDVFENEKLGADKKSVALHFTFADAQKTLTDEEVESDMSLIMKSLQDKVGAAIRGL
jgi:phenylalanyl-tRNA synthetase beta chain